MNNPQDPRPPKARIEDVLAEFAAKEDLLEALCVRTRSLIEAGLQDAGIKFHSIQSRVKGRKKLEEKFRDPKKNYLKLGDITDLAGLRVITYYEDDVDRAAQVLLREFDIDHQNSVDKRKIEPDRFGYSALNFVCRHRKERTLDVEFKKFAGVCCEIQVTSILSHAWSEIEHEWYDLRTSYPDEIKRRFSRLSALLELAEAEFGDIRKSRTQYERSVAVQVEANVPDLMVDAVSLRSFIDQEPIVGEIDNLIAHSMEVAVSPELDNSMLEFRAAAANLAGMTKLQDIKTSLARLGPKIPEYVRRCGEELWPQHYHSHRTQKDEIGKGLCIYHLAAILVASQGATASQNFFAKLGFSTEFNIARQVEIAREIAAQT